MAKVVTNTGKLSAADRAAIATYVKSLPPVVGPKPPRASEVVPSFRRATRVPE